jgi:hypothetical protein
LRLAILSDIHYAGAAEKERHDYPYAAIRNPLRRFVTRQYRHWLWHRDPFAHNHLLDQFLKEVSGADLVVANGDYSCDSAGIGVVDDAAFQSANECLGKLRQSFGSRLRAVIGDHEIGKIMMSAPVGGLRLASYRRAVTELKLEPLWRHEIGNRVLIGITSTLVALPVYAAEALPEELPEWERLRAEHLQGIREHFRSLQTDQRVLLFCHDPSALPFLWRDEVISSRLAQMERTILGHLHSILTFRLSGGLSGMPAIPFLGHTARRLSVALREARCWRHFKPLLCPSTSGIQLLKDGGYLTAELEASGTVEMRFELHRLKW